MHLRTWVEAEADSCARLADEMSVNFLTLPITKGISSSLTWPITCDVIMIESSCWPRSSTQFSRKSELRR